MAGPNTYAGVSFDIKKRNGFHPGWRRARQYARELPVNGQGEWLAEVGVGNYVLELVACNISGAEAEGLILAEGVTSRELLLRGITYSNVMLTAVLESPPSEADHDDYVELELRFERAN